MKRSIALLATIVAVLAGSLGHAQTAHVECGEGRLDMSARSTPSNPPSGVRRIFVDDGTGKLSVRTSSGTTVSLEEQGGGGGGSLPSGAIVLILSGTCPTGFTEETALSGKFVLGTVAANADIGTTGGSDSITTVLNHTHPVTDPGHAHGMAEGTTDGSGTFMDRSNAAAAAAAVTDSATTGVTTANPAGGVASIDNRPAFIRVIFCKAN